MHNSSETKINFVDAIAQAFVTLNFCW